MTRRHLVPLPTAAPWRGPRRGATTVAAALLVAACAAPALAVPPPPRPTAPVPAPAPLATAAPLATSPATTDAGAGAHARYGRGTLRSVTPLARLSRDEVAHAVGEHGVDVSSVRHGIATHRIEYATITPTGEPTTASALLTLPDGGGHALSTVAELHGTVAHREDAPSVGDNVTRLGAYLYAAGGRATVAPDYLGLGTSPGTHPYMDTASSVSASLDALRAARTATARLGRALTGEVHVTGFSQGGQVAMGLGRALAHGADRHLRLRSLTPVSGPYDIAGQELPAIFDGRVDDGSAVFYLAYFLTAQNRLHPLYDDPREVFRQPYADRMETLFDGEHSDEDVARGLPATVDALLTEEWKARLQHPTGTLAEVIEGIDGTCAWRPRVPVRLHTAAGDRDVPTGNTTSCASELRRRGAHPEVVRHGDVDHLRGYLGALSDNARWLAHHG
ncbi:alpha/beta hydrolase [Streptomyces sp. 71268]|uniref:alpha/beta hydrolase n=1 Tax=Streptomyces sp. 71268 TaxID=3002640 RepID=UPI0023F62DA2|nr:alpha/beta hydrolase [Streptomyces sp. 71268]WEV25263.1 alpha/beta hydrolase [Streptomyces sp. 71268]